MPCRAACFALVVLLLAPSLASAAVALPVPAPDGLTFEQLSALRNVTEARLSPDGTLVAYTLDVPRTLGREPDGPDWRELHVVPFEGGAPRALVKGAVVVSRAAFTPGGTELTYLTALSRDESGALWLVPVRGGRPRRLHEHEGGIHDYRVSPDGTRLAFLGDEPLTGARRARRALGYLQEVFEEDWRPRRVYVAPLDLRRGRVGAAVPLPVRGSVFGLEWSPDGRRLALAVAPRPLPDDRVLNRQIVIVAADGEERARIRNPGKLGAFAFRPDGTRLALLAAGERTDPEAGRLLVASTEGGALEDALPELRGDVTDLAWLPDDRLVYLADRGVTSFVAELGDPADGQRWSVAPEGFALRTLSLSNDGRRAVLCASRPDHPSEAYVAEVGRDALRRLTNSNPALAAVRMAPQEIVSYAARDGLPLEGILLRPLDRPAGTRVPLVLMVHGGPQEHDRNGWVTSYSRPGQIAAARGYAVFYPNYRGSSGRGAAFAKAGQGDAGGKEFDDLVDAADHLIRAGVADKERIGIAGGSYGGYGTAWCATYYTAWFRAAVMFVGISNELTNSLTTHVPEVNVETQTGYEPWTNWMESLQRSPLYYAPRSRTPILLLGGTDDIRVDPGQSLALYRAFRRIGRTPVRYVRYPGEGHHASRVATRDDIARRLVQWMDHYLLGPGGDPPPWDLWQPVDRAAGSAAP